MSGTGGLVFRDTATVRAAADLVEEVVRAVLLAQSGGRAVEDRLLTALVSAGTLEAGLADAGAPAAGNAARATDRIARAQRRRELAPLAGLAGEISTWPVPARLRVSPPEGFAYYALVPGEVAAAACAIGDGPALVVGVRSIGTTLSAAVCAALEERGRPAERFTLRPEGHPHDRVTRLDAHAANAVKRHRDASWFIVVDEGPGQSGSSFLSTGEALEAAGAPRDRIVFLGTRPTDPATLVARDGAARWNRFRFVAAGAPPPPPELDLSAGAWRAAFWPDRRHWPASWVGLERVKRLAPDRRSLLKFEGLGGHGAAPHARAATLAAEGWSPHPTTADASGMVAYPFPAGVPLQRGETTVDLLATLGRYCAARAALFPAQPAGQESLAAMARHNVALEVGHRLPESWSLPCERPAITDGRMLPHEWLRTRQGKLLKTDAVSHGDDHHYPGPTDVAWDLAGTIVEWSLDGPAQERVVGAYRASAGEDPTRRLRPYLIAYAAFRAAASAMAAAFSPPEEAARLEAAREGYRGALRAALAG